jgi:hypothetical protein
MFTSTIGLGRSAGVLGRDVGFRPPQSSALTTGNRGPFIHKSRRTYGRGSPLGSAASGLPEAG